MDEGGNSEAEDRRMVEVDDNEHPGSGVKWKGEKVETGKERDMEVDERENPGTGVEEKAEKMEEVETGKEEEMEGTEEGFFGSFWILESG